MEFTPVTHPEFFEPYGTITLSVGPTFWDPTDRAPIFIRPEGSISRPGECSRGWLFGISGAMCLRSAGYSVTMSKDAGYHKTRCAWCMNGEPCPNYDELIRAEGLQMTPTDRERFDRIGVFASVESEKVGDVIRITATEPPTTTDHGCIVTGHMEGAVLVVDQIEDLPPEKS